MKTLSLGEIEGAVNGKLNSWKYEALTVSCVSTDSRTIPPGSLFVALEGKNFNGHDFIPQAVENGAACVLSEAETKGAPYPVIQVESTKQALLDLAAYYRSLFNVKVVAVTGSTGKTTTKDMIASVLSQKYHVLKTDGNLNNTIGLPLTLFMLDESHDAAVLEMGMSSAGEIFLLSEAARPDIAVITNIGSAHLESLGSIEAILAAKCEIFAGMPEKGKIFLNGDDKMLQTVRSDLLDIKYYGINKNNDYIARGVTNRGMDGVSYTVVCPDGTNVEIDVQFPGEHMVANSMAAVLVGCEMGLDADEIANGVAKFIPSQLRLEMRKNKNGVTVINDTYNANPDSVRAAIDVLLSAAGRKICVLGDMLELGRASNDMHYEVGRYAAEKNIDLIICVGTHSRYTYEGVYYEIDKGKTLSQAMYFMDKENVEDNIASILKKGDTILLKASRGMKFEEISNKLLE